jgi:hypothetical protein
MLADVRARGDDRATTAFAGHVATALFWTLLAVSSLGVIAAPVLVWLIASGLARDPAAFDLASVMTRWMFPYILFMSLVAMAAGVLNTYRRFAVPAFTPVLLNLSFIGCALWLAPRLEQPIMLLHLRHRRRAAARLQGALHRAPELASPRAAFRPAVRRVAPDVARNIRCRSRRCIIINTNIAAPGHRQRHLAHSQTG